MASKMTIEKLAMMIQAGFKRMYKHLASKEDILKLRMELKNGFKKDKKILKTKPRMS